MTKNAEFYTPENLLQEKTGVGGLPPIMLENAQSSADGVVFDYQPFASEKIKSMKDQLNDESFINAQNDNSIDDFLFNLVPFDVTTKLSKNQALSSVSNHLLKFVESLKTFNIDSHHVIKAHINAMEIMAKQKITNPDDKITQVIVKELTDVCQRYYTKHGHPNVEYIDG